MPVQKVVSELKNLHFRNKTRCKTFHVRMSLICMTIKHCFHMSLRTLPRCEKAAKGQKINFKACLGRKLHFETVWRTFLSSILSFVRNGFPVTTSFPVSRCFPCSMGRRDETSLGTKQVDLPKNSYLCKVFN